MTNFSSGYDIDILPGQGLITSIVREQKTLSLPTEHTTRPAAWLFAVIIASALLIAPHQTRAAGYSANDIIAGSNDVRTANGLAPLTPNDQLTAAAQTKAADMFARQYFDHYSPTGQAPWYWVQQSGYSFTSAGENLAVDFADGADVIDAWMHSTTHRANLLSNKFNDIGVAVVDGTMNGLSTTLVVQFFGSQKVAQSATPVVSQPKTLAPKTTLKTPLKATAPVTTKVAQVKPSFETQPVIVPITQPESTEPQPQVLGISDQLPNPQPKPVKIIIPVALALVNSDELAQSPVSSQLPALLVATFAGYMALFGLAGVLAYLHKSVLEGVEKPVKIPAISLA